MLDFIQLDGENVRWFTPQIFSSYNYMKTCSLVWCCCLHLITVYQESTISSWSWLLLLQL